jgi:hypothetical protein
MSVPVPHDSSGTNAKSAPSLNYGRMRVFILARMSVALRQDEAVRFRRPVAAADRDQIHAG